MADPKETRRISEPSEEKQRSGSPGEQVPGHTPGKAEGEEERAPRRDMPNPPPDKTPGRSEG